MHTSPGFNVLIKIVGNMFLRVGKSKEFVKNNLLCNKSFKIQDGSQLLPVIVAINLCVLHYYRFERTITDLNKQKQTLPKSYVSIYDNLGC